MTQPPDTSSAFSASLYDHESGEWVEVPAHEISEKIQSGRYTYQSGLEIPVVNSNGEMGSISSDAAYDEFKFNGIKPLTADIQKAFESRENEKILESVYGNNPVDAAIAGALRTSTLGLSDAVLGAAGVGEAAAQLKERNPIASTVGEIGGAAATMGTGAARAATAAVERGTAAALGASTAAKVAAKAVPAAVEGAYFGTGQGISEAALGNPENVVSNLVSNIGAGALFGGAVGTAFGGISAGKPLFDKTLSRLIDGSGDMVQQAANKVGYKGLQAALTAKGKLEAAAKVKDFAALPLETQQFITREGVDAYKALQAELKPLTKEVKQTLSELRQDLTKTVESASDEVRQATNAFVKKAGDDVFQAAKISDEYVRNAEQQLKEISASLGGAQGPYKIAPLVTGIDDVVSKLRASGDTASIRAANRLEALTTSSQLMREGDQASFFLKMQQTLEPYRGKSNLLDGLYSMSDESLAKFPNPLVSQAYKTFQTQRLASDALKDVADRTVMRRSKAMLGERARGESVYDETKAFRTLLNPRHREAVETAINSLDQLAPELQQWQQLQLIKKGTDRIAAQVAFQDAVESKLKQAFPEGKVDVDAVESLFEMIGPVKNVERQLSKVRELQQLTTTAGESPVTRMIAIKKALGKEVGADLQKLATFEKHIDLMQHLREVDLPGVSPSKALLGGLAMGDLVGAVLGAQKTSASRYVDSIQAVEHLASKGARQLSKAVQKATDRLTGPAAAKAARATTAAVDKGPTLKEQRQRFHQVKDELARPMQPMVSTQLLPQVTKALEAKRSQVNDFIQQKMPQDPFASTSLSLNNTDYLPSDQELSTFFRYVTAVESPVSVVDAISNGTATSEEVETLKTIYPDIYKTLQESVLDAIIEKKVNLSYQQKVNLSTLLDVPTDPTLRPDFVARMQESITKNEGGRPEGTGGNRKITLNLDPGQTVATAAQQTEYKA